MRPALQRQTTDQILEYYYEDQPIPRAHRPTARESAHRHLHLVELDMDPDLARRFQPRVALVAPASPRAAPPPRPPRLSSPPPKSSPSPSFRSLASATEKLVPAPIIRGNSDYSILAVSDSSEAPDEPGHKREVCQSPADGGYFSPLGSVDEDPDDRPTGTITSRSTRTTPSVASIYTPSSQSNYTQSGEMLDLTLSDLPPDDKSTHSPRASLNYDQTIREFRPSPRTSLADFSRVSSTRNSPRPSLSDLASVSEFPKYDYDTRSPEKHRLRDLSPEKPASSPEKSRPRELSPASGSKSRVEQVLNDSASSPLNRTGSGSSLVPRNESPRTVESFRKPNEKRFSPPRSEKPRLPNNVPTITRSSYEHSELSSLTSRSPRSPRHPISPRSTHPTTPDLKFRQPGSALPESFYFPDVLKLKTSSERAQAYTRKINQLAAEDSGLGYWVGFMKGRVKPGPDAPPSSGPTSPNASTTFGPLGPGTRRQQPRHVSGGSVASEVTFAVRPDAYVATNISIRSNSPPLAGPPPALPYPSLAKDIGLRSVEPRPTVPTPGMKAKVGSIGLFSNIGRKSSVRREKDRMVMQQARKPHVLRTGSGSSYGELAASPKPVTLSTPPTIPGGPRARRDKRVMGDTASDSGHSYTHTLEPHPRSSVIMIGGRDSFQTMSPSGDGRPVSIRVPSSNGHGVITPNLPTSPNSSLFSGSGMPPSSYREGSVYSRESVRDRGSRASSMVGHGGGNVDHLVDVLPHVDRAVLQGYLDRANGHEIDAISAYLEDESR